MTSVRLDAPPPKSTQPCGLVSVALALVAPRLRWISDSAPPEEMVPVLVRLADDVLVPDPAEQLAEAAAGVADGLTETAPFRPLRRGRRSWRQRTRGIGCSPKHRRPLRSYWPQRFRSQSRWSWSPRTRTRRSMSASVRAPEQPRECVTLGNARCVGLGTRCARSSSSGTKIEHRNRIAAPSRLISSAPVRGREASRCNSCQPPSGVASSTR